MSDVNYEIVEHDGGWAYKVGDVFSEPFRTREEAVRAAQRAANEQRVPGETTPIQYEDSSGKWHVDVAAGSDRPSTSVSEE